MWASAGCIAVNLRRVYLPAASAGLAFNSHISHKITSLLCGLSFGVKDGAVQRIAHGVNAVVIPVWQVRQENAVTIHLIGIIDKFLVAVRGSFRINDNLTPLQPLNAINNAAGFLVARNTGV